MVITHSMKVCGSQHLATSSQGQYHNFDSNLVRSCYTQNHVSGVDSFDILIVYLKEVFENAADYNKGKEKNPT